MSVKVLFLHKCFVQGGGVERVHQNLSLALQKASVESTFYVMDGYGKSETGFKALSTKFNAHRCEKHKGFLQNLKDIKRLVKENNIDLIISATEKANLAAFLSKLINPKTKVIYTRHCAFDVSDQKLPPFAIKALYSLFATNGQVVAVSDTLKQQIQQSLLFNKNKVHFIPNAVIHEEIYQKAEEPLPIDFDTPYFIAVGRLVEQKGFDILINAYSNALKANKELPPLKILGEGEDNEALKNQSEALKISDKIHFAGFTTNPYAPIKNAICFILSSRHEGMPTVMIEALALKTPVIAFDCPTGPAEIIKQGKNGMLIEYLNEEALTKAILQYQTLPHTDLNKEVQNFTFSAVAKKYLSVSGVHINE